MVLDLVVFAATMFELRAEVFALLVVDGVNAFVVFSKDAVVLVVFGVKVNLGKRSTAVVLEVLFIPSFAFTFSDLIKSGFAVRGAGLVLGGGTAVIADLGKLCIFDFPVKATAP